MAPKKPNPLEHPPSADPSSDEEVSNEAEEEEEDDDSDESEEDEETQPKPSEKPPPPPAPEKKKPHIVIKKKSDPKPASPVRSSDASDSGSDSDAIPPVSDLAKSVTVAIPSPAPDFKLAKKRAADGIDYAKNFKKLKEVAATDARNTSTKTVAGVEDEVKKVGEDAKKLLFQRLFSEEDEIELLKGMLKYSAEKGIDPIADLSNFHQYVKETIHVDVTSAQLSAKIKRLRKKYLKNASKSKKGVERSFSRPHEQLSYDLSKKIWGAGNAKEVTQAVTAQAANGGVVAKVVGKGKRTPKPNMTPDQKEKHASSLQIPLSKNEKEHVHCNGSSSSFCLAEVIKSKDAVGMGLSEEFFKKGLELLGDEVKARLEEKWKSLVVAEAELYYRRVEITREQMKLTLDAYKSSGH